MSRLLFENEIEDILNFITPNEGIPNDVAIVIMNNNKQRIKSQLKNQLVHPEIIPHLKKEIEKQYFSTLVHPGESLGIVCAQSIGEKQTQTTLNSLDYQEQILYINNNVACVQPIGEIIDNLLNSSPPENITHIEENRTEYLPIPDGYYIPSCDENGNCNWYKIEAVTRHLPVGQLVKVTTQSGRTVTATQSKSFLVWDGKKFEGTMGCDVEVGDFLPTTQQLPRFKNTEEYFFMESIFPKNEYLYTTEVVKARKYKDTEAFWWSRHSGRDFVVPYARPDTMFRRKEFMETCEPGFIYIHKSTKFVSHFPDKILLDNDFGFLFGIYLAEGLTTLTYTCISNNDPVIRKRVTDFCDRYGVTYHLVTSAGKNGVNGESNDLKLHSVLLARLLFRTCDTGSESKRVPEFAYTAPEDFIKGLLDGYFSGDGTVNKQDGTVSVGSISEKLIMGISFLLSYLGIFGRMTNGLQKKNNVGSKNIKRMYTLRISNGFAKRFARKIQMTEGRKQEKLSRITLNKNYRYLKGRTQEGFPNRNVYFDEVVSVEYVDGTTPFVYDFTVAETRNFSVWNGLNCCDTFHSAGQSEKTMTVGVPRFQELLNATKTPKSINCKLFFNENMDSIEKLRKSVNHTLCGLTFKTLSRKIDICLNKEPEYWYDAFKILYNNDFEQYEHCISIKLNMDILFEFDLKMKDIAAKVFSEYYDLACVFSPPQEGQIDIFVDTSRINLPENRILFIDSENAVEIYLEECVQPTIENMSIAGIEGLKNIYYAKIPDTEPAEWMIETNGGKLTTILSHPLIDITRTVSNDIWDIYNVLGIEATRQFLIEEYMNIMEGINVCHVKVLVERMTFIGTISSISRYTMRTDDNGILSRISFEETLEGFRNAGSNGVVENTNGVSASIICGKRAQIGTGMMDLLIDIDKLPVIDEKVSFEDFAQEEKVSFEDFIREEKVSFEDFIQEEKEHRPILEDKVFEIDAGNGIKIENMEEKLHNILSENFEEKAVPKKKTKNVVEEKKPSKKNAVAEKKKSSKKTFEDIIVDEKKKSSKKKKTLEDIIMDDEKGEDKKLKKSDDKKPKKKLVK
jgi:DNA-directed RNA polymerase subunit A"